MSYSPHHRPPREGVQPQAARERGAASGTHHRLEPVPMTELNLSVQRHGDHATIQVGGEVDIATCPQLQAVLRELVDRGFHQLIIDLEQVSFLDCSGIRVLVDALRRVQAHRGSVRLVRPTSPVWRVLALTGMTTVFPIDSPAGEAPGHEEAGRRTPS
jgi:anti-sigma B factor antagonist